MSTAPKLEELIKGLTTLGSIKEDLWGLSKIPTSDFDVVVDIGSGDGLFSKLASKYHDTAAIIKADTREHCEGDDVIPLQMSYSADIVYVTRPAIMYADQFGRPILNIIATEQRASMPLHEFLDKYTGEFKNERIVLKLSDVSIEHMVSEIPYIHNVKALLIVTPAYRDSVTKSFIDTLRQVFDLVEDKSSGEVLYVRCYNLKGTLETSNQLLLGSCGNPNSSYDNNNS